MAEEKKGFLVYCDLIHTVKLLPDEIAGKLFKHLLAYVNDENPITDNLMVSLAFEPIKQSLKRDLKKWEGKKEGYSNNGKIGNLKRYNKDIYEKFKNDEITLDEALELAEVRKSSPPDQPRSPTIAKLAVKDSVSVSVNDRVNVNVKDNVIVNDILPLKVNPNKVNEVLKMFDETNFKQKEIIYKTNKENIRIKLLEFLETESLNDTFVNKPLGNVIKHFFNWLQYRKPREVVSKDNSVPNWITDKR